MTTLIEAANWWEPGQNGTFDIGDLSAIFMFLLAVVGAVIAFNRWWLKKIHKMIRDEVQEFTKPIQPNANGGLSLPDVSRKVDTMDAMLCEIKQSGDDTKDMLTKLLLSMMLEHKDEKKAD